MKKTLALAAALVAVAGLQWAAAPADAADAPYPDSIPVTVKVGLNHAEITGGKVLHIEAVSASGDTTPEGTLTVKAFGKTFTSDVNKVSVDVKTPAVTTDTLEQIDATFVGAEIADGAAASTSVVVPAVFVRTSAARALNAASIYKSATASTKVLLLAAGSDTSGSTTSGTGSGSSSGSGLLPNTGGPSWTLVGLGILLLALGGAIVVGSRRRQHGAH